jgi:hypothetical protein
MNGTAVSIFACDFLEPCMHQVQGMTLVRRIHYSMGNDRMQVKKESLLFP